MDPKYIFWDNIDTNSFILFIRDLSESLNVNLKHIIEDLYMNQPKIINKKKGKNNKKKIIKKKDIIIQEQNKKREIKIINEELNYINYFIKNIQNENPYLNFNKIKTERGRQRFKLELLKYYLSDKKLQKRYLSHILNLYFNIKYKNNEYICDDKEYKKISSKLEKQLEEYDYKTYMMKELGHLLPPLNFWDKENFN